MPGCCCRVIADRAALSYRLVLVCRVALGCYPALACRDALGCRPISSGTEPLPNIARRWAAGIVKLPLLGSEQRQFFIWGAICLPHQGFGGLCRF